MYINNLALPSEIICGAVQDTNKQELLKIILMIIVEETTERGGGNGYEITIDTKIVARKEFHAKPT